MASSNTAVVTCRNMPDLFDLGALDNAAPGLPARHNPPMHLHPTIRLAMPDEARALAAMSRDWIEHGLGWSWTAARVSQAIVDASTNVAVLVRDEQLKGFGIMQYLDDDTAHLGLLAVSPVLRHQGMGRQLLVWLEESAQVAGSTAIRLECRADNINAIAFYRHLGYRQVGTVSGYYEGHVDAVRLLKRQVARQP